MTRAHHVKFMPRGCRESTDSEKGTRRAQRRTCCDGAKKKRVDGATVCADCGRQLNIESFLGIAGELLTGD